MNDYLVFALFFVAIAIGWFLGRRGHAKPRGRSPDLPGQYYRGLNYLLDGKPDGAVDAFINALEVNSETLETHIALGNLLRNLLYLALAVAMAAVGVLFALQNEMPVPLDLLIVSFEPRSLALWLLIAFALGGLLGMLMSSALVLRTRTALASANRQLARSRAELDKLRTAGLKDGE